MNNLLKPVWPYINLMRLNKPIGIWLLYLPCLFGLALASKQLAADKIYFIREGCWFLAGAVVMRSAGCILNDIFDCNFDQKVARTQSRPLASGELNLKQALILLFALAMLGLLILLRFNFLTVILGFIITVLVIIYPLAKRFTYYPQFLLGLVFNSGILLAGSAVLNKLSLAFWLFYCSAICWTLIYDTIYAYQDVEDDLKIGVKSTAIKFGANPRPVLLGLNVTQFFFQLLAGWALNLCLPYYLLIFLAFSYLFWQIKSCNFSSVVDCLHKFKANLWVGLIIWGAIILG